MKKLLLMFTQDIRNNIEFERIISLFENKGYIIHNFEGLEKEGVNIHIFSAAVDYIKAEYKDDIERIVVISNLKYLILTWFRCYNSLVDDFVFFLDDIEASINDFDSSDNFISQMSKFNSILSEHIEGKIYININHLNYKPFLTLLLLNGNHRYFDRIEKYNFDVTEHKKIVYKKYRFNDSIISFLPQELNNDCLVQEIEIVPTKETTLRLSLSIFLDVFEYDPALFAISMLGAYVIGSKSIFEWVMERFYELREIDQGRKNEIIHVINNHISNKNTGFVEKAHFLSFLSALNNNIWILDN